MKKLSIKLVMWLFLMTITLGSTVNLGYSQNNKPDKTTIKDTVSVNLPTAKVDSIIFTGTEKTFEDSINTVIQKPEYKNISEILNDVKIMYKEYNELKKNPETTGVDWYNFWSLLVVILIAIVSYISAYFVHKPKKKEPEEGNS